MQMTKISSLPLALSEVRRLSNRGPLDLRIPSCYFVMVIGALVRHSFTTFRLPLISGQANAGARYNINAMAGHATNVDNMDVFHFLFANRTRHRGAPSAVNSSSATANCIAIPANLGASES
jgi:hypothetical protein